MGRWANLPSFLSRTRGCSLGNTGCGNGASPRPAGTQGPASTPADHSGVHDGAHRGGPAGVTSSQDEGPAFAPSSRGVGFLVLDRRPRSRERTESQALSSSLKADSAGQGRILPVKVSCILGGVWTPQPSGLSSLLCRLPSSVRTVS